MNKNLAALKKEFPTLNERFGGRRLVYLDSACTVLKLRCAADAQRRHMLLLGGCGGKRSLHSLASAMEENFHAARSVAASFMGGSPEEVIFTAGVTDAANLLANSFPFTPQRSEVVLSPLEHNAVFLPFERLAAAGRIKLRVAPLKDFGVDLDGLARLVTRRTALVCVTHAPNIFGGTADVRRAAEIAHAAGAYLFCDDAQYAPTHGRCGAADGADACAFSGHKLGAPYFTGALCVKRPLLERLRPSRVGGGTVAEVAAAAGRYSVRYLGGYQGFEAGVQNYSGAAGLAAALERLTRAGFPAIRAHVSSLVSASLKELGGVKGVRVLGRPEDIPGGSLVSLAPAVKGFSVPDFSLFLNEGVKGSLIAVRTGRHCADLACLNSGYAETIRLSFFAYNTPGDVSCFAGALEKYLSLLGRGK
ncbi:MAG: aminotransferase class V-fold PLP-dependent enzyme [Elusimicrobiales bacterium]|nr:aminotransferase class V-fold PLP-dependent enzyme [Elusimicrobiales bacterium]